MNTHEYQAKNLLARFGIPVPPFCVASNEKEINQAIAELRLKEAVLKVQIHAGGRGKAGGVRFAKTPEEIVRVGKEMLGMRITNAQTGPHGVVAQKILISAPVAIQKEYYVAAVIDRAAALPILMVSSEGGMEIEEIAQRSPEKILRIPMGLNGKIRNYHLFEVAKRMGWTGELKKEGMALLSNLARAFIECDGSLLEINPLVLTQEGHLTALDAKFSIDDNALFRQSAIAQWYDPSQQTQGEVMAKKYDLAYIGLEGDIGCLVNGAGLAMATMDMIYYSGGAPANFLDVGGGATKEQIAHGFKIILLDPRVRSIFVNIFGGIMDCGILAEGIVAASKEDKVQVPLIVRMEGTNVEKGKQILKDSGLNIISAETMSEGAAKAVKAAQG